MHFNHELFEEKVSILDEDSVIEDWMGNEKKR